MRQSKDLESKGIGENRRRRVFGICRTISKKWSIIQPLYPLRSSLRRPKRDGVANQTSL
jgi:hypothetical protein